MAASAGSSVFSHARRETRQFFAGKFSLGVELIGKSNHARLIFRGETFDLLDDLLSGHAPMLMHTAMTFNLSERRKSLFRRDAETNT